MKLINTKKIFLLLGFRMLQKNIDLNIPIKILFSEKDFKIKKWYLFHFKKQLKTNWCHNKVLLQPTKHFQNTKIF